ncbi:hypothetical protein [Ralstonia solanacearum]|uniref:hypothetical protein n=1 Tax=Ralstonia solanacearum TaxID=305 RepID=UPI0005ACCF94|nr:hypothetical protein [Ralstonia solanacearum]
MQSLQHGRDALGNRIGHGLRKHEAPERQRRHTERNQPGDGNGVADGWRQLGQRKQPKRQDQQEQSVQNGGPVLERVAAADDDIDPAAVPQLQEAAGPGKLAGPQLPIGAGNQCQHGGPVDLAADNTGGTLDQQRIQLFQQKGPGGGIQPILLEGVNQEPAAAPADALCQRQNAVELEAAQQ